MKKGFHPEEVLFCPTTRCNLECPHCQTKKPSVDLLEALAVKFLRQCAGLGINKIGFTGGEPFLALDFLCAVSKKAVGYDMLFDKIMTNGVWYKKKAGLRKSLEKLYKSGYDGTICVSVDAFHRQDLHKVSDFIKTTIAVWGRKDVVSIACVLGMRDDVTRKKLDRLAEVLKARLIGFGTGSAHIKSPELFIKILNIELTPVGKAARLKCAADNEWFADDYCEGPGNVFFVEASGDVKPCCGYAEDSKTLAIGNIRSDSAAAILRSAHSNRYVQAVFGAGLAKLRRKLENAGVIFGFKTKNHCYFCNHVLTKVPKDILGKCLT